MFKRDKKFFPEKEFINNYDTEINNALALYARMSEKGSQENILRVFDFDFISDKKEKLGELSLFLSDNYGFKMDEVKKEKRHWILTGTSLSQSYNEEKLLYWVLDLYVKGYKFDCRFTGYGSLYDPDNIEFLQLEGETAKSFYNKGIDAINKSNFGAAIICFAAALELEPTDASIWYAKGYCKEQIYSYNGAMKDYDEALKLDPGFVDALTARGANNDERGNYEEALKDYNKAIEVAPESSTAYFNRGNTKFNLGDRNGACEDWSKARSLGSPYAQGRISKECRSEKFNLD